MPLTDVPTDILYMVADHLRPHDHSALTLASRHFASALQPHLLSSLRQLPLQRPYKYATLALHWYAASGDHDQLKFLLEHVAGITIAPASNHRRHRYTPTPTYTNTTILDTPTWDRLRTLGPHLRLFGPCPPRTPSWKRRSMTAVEFALSTNNTPLLHLCLTHDPSSNTALSTLRYAARHARFSACRTLLTSFHATLDAPTFTLVHSEWLLLVTHLRGIRFLLDGAALSSRDATGRTLLHRVVTGAVLAPPSANSHPDTVHAVLARGADVGARDDDGCTPLHLAAAAGFVDVVDLLLRGGADVGARDATGGTPAHLALRRGGEGRWAVVALLKEHGADFGVADGEGVVVSDLMEGPRVMRRRA